MATREAAVLAVEMEDMVVAVTALAAAVLGRDVAGGSLDVEGAVAGLVVFEAAATPKALVAVIELDLEKVEAAVLLSEAAAAPPTLGLVEVLDFERVEAAVLLLNPAVPPTALVAVEELDFGRVEATVLFAEAVVLGRASLTVSVPGLFLKEPFPVVGLVPFVTVAAATEVVLAGPAGFL